MHKLLVLLWAFFAGCTATKSNESSLERAGAPTPIQGRAFVERGAKAENRVLRPDEFPDITLCLTGDDATRFAVGDVVTIVGAWKSAPALAGEKCMVFDAESIALAESS